MKNQLTPEQLFEYASKSFRFKNLSLLRFGGWSEARHFYKNRRQRHAAMECKAAMRLAESQNNEQKKDSRWKNQGIRPGIRFFFFYSKFI